MTLLACSPNQAPRCKGFGHTKLPLVLHMDVRESRIYVLAIEEAIASWERQTGRKLFVLEMTQDSLYPIKRDGRNSVYIMTNWEPDRVNEQGRTSLYYMGGVATEADIRINIKDFKYYIGDVPPLSPMPSGVNLETLFMHELGHALGLFHLEEPKYKGSVMFPYLEDGVKRMTLTPNDLEGFQCLYGKSIL